DAGIDGRAFFFGGARFSNARVSEDAMASIEPSIRAPGEAVERFVCVFVMPAVEQDLWFAVRLVVVVFVGNKQQIRRLSDPDTAEADFQPAHEVQALNEHLSAVVLPVA